MKDTSKNPSTDQASTDYKSRFKPYVEILLGIQFRPLFASQMVRNQCSIPVPIELQKQPPQDEIQAVITIYKNHVSTALSPNISRHVNGFHYHRQHNCCLKFDVDSTLEKIVSVQPLQSRKSPLGNRVVDLLSGGRR